MELLAILGIVAPAMFAVRSLYETIQKYLGEKDFEKELNKQLLKDEEFRSTFQRVVKNMSEFKDDPRVLAEADAIITKALENTNERTRLSVQEGLRQPSERGRINYVSKLLEDVAQATPSSTSGVEPGV